MIIRMLIAIIVAVGLVPTLAARPAHKQALAQYFGPLLPKKLNDCRTCHLPEDPGEASQEDVERPHNSFGARLKAVRSGLRKAGKSATLEASLEAILEEDSDGDGINNRLEILTGHFPGDKDDRVLAEEVVRAKAAIVEFAKLKSGYPWRPFEIVTRPPVPRVKNVEWVRNPIDAFIAAEHEALGLMPRPEAPRAVLLRRVYLDLIGLPPTPAELHAFLQDASPNAYEKVVDRLLDDPRHGERWGRHWMDVWRYSDWAGYGAQVRDSQPHIWRWRDWIVEAVNTDKGYDRMILEMLAGDELAPEDPKALIATGYLVRNWKLLSREKWLQDTVEHTAQAFLGITLQCAKCHDHMFDPILQKEYYQVRAIFEPHDVRTDRLPGQPDPKIDGLPRVFDKNLAAATFLFVRGDDRTPEKNPLPPAVPEALGGSFKVEPIKLPPGAVFPDKRDFVIRELLTAGEKQIDVARQARSEVRRRQVSALLQVLQSDPLRATVGLIGSQRIVTSMAIRELDLPLAEAKHAVLLASLKAEQLEDAGQQGTDAWKQAALAAVQAQRRFALIEAQRKLAGARLAFFATERAPTLAQKQKQLEAAEKELAKANADVKLPPSTDFAKRTPAIYPATSTGRRLAFARWLADRDNPLTARVAVNHMWLRHFGQGIVPTVFDFGKNGRPPSHPALLDWLAAEFMNPTLSSPGSQDRSGSWSMKHLHRLMVTSSAYRLASTPDAANAALDRDNKYLWRHPPRRLEAEAVRDAVFYVAGKLDPKMGGPDIDYPLGLTVPRRSLYFRHAAEKQMDFLQIFDAASVTECYERKHSIVPQQALALMNSELTLKHARILARIMADKTNGDASAFTTSAFEHVLSRPPTFAEMAECVAFIQEQTHQLQQTTTPGPAGSTADGNLPAPNPELRARENLVHVLLNHHEFVTIR
jgi:hypothetical protein